MTQTAKLTASENQEFPAAWSVAISDNAVVAGSVEAMVDGKYRQGAAYVFTEPASGWADMLQSATLTASDGRRRTFSARRSRSTATTS